MKRRIKKVAVLGSGIMGSRIACHFANAGVPVLLLDIPAKDAASDDKAARNKLVNDYLQNAIKSNPSPVYSRSASITGLIETGNFEDDFQKISECDWILEAVIERLDIKQQIFQKVEQYRKPGSIVSTNTSGIPVALMNQERSEDFRRHFCGTHFFNPPRYLQLLEIIPGPDTNAEVISFLEDYGTRNLGKTVVLCKDTPAFIANRIGVFSIMSLFHAVPKQGLTVEEVDKLTGPVIGRPKSATFRTCDVVGLDTLVHVANGLRENLKNDEALDMFSLPGYISAMIENKMLGSKTEAGFYKKVKLKEGSEIQALNLSNLTYQSSVKVKFPTLELTKTIENVAARYPVLFEGEDKAGIFYRESFCRLFAYVSNRIPEIADEIYKIDDAMRAGFGWELGPFESWEAIGVKKALETMKDLCLSCAGWVQDMLNKDINSFYRIHDGKRQYYSVLNQKFEDIPGQEGTLVFSVRKHTHTIWNHQDASSIDLGDGVLGLEFHTKMNTIGGGVIQGIQKVIDLAEKEYEGVVIYNEGQNFSAGANVGMIFMMAAEGDWDELDLAIRTFQNTMMRIRYSSVPVVVAPHGLALGGGCEMSMHADKVIAHAETYMGLVEFGVGVIPGGGGTKEFALRLSDELHEGDMRINQFRNRFLTIGQAKVSTSATEAFELGYLRKGIDEIVISRKLQLSRAKRAVLNMVENGYSRPVERNDITVLGQEAMGIVYVGANSMFSGNYISEHDVSISRKLGFVMAGGNLSGLQQVSERYLLDMERRAFMELCSERKTLERMQSLIKSGKILRN
jgi:3-hydroxyacyl-CoA dehydrogenase